MSVVVLLNTIDKVKSFVNAVALLDADLDLASGRYTVDAKSILGIFSLDILEPLTLNIHGDLDTQCDVLREIQDYVCAE